MNKLKERTLFLREAFRDIHEVGSIIPSSRATGRAMTAAFRARETPARVLEAGAGTGPITLHIVSDMRKGDRLDLYEINPDYVRFLASRFEHEPAFQRVKSQCHIYEESIETIEKKPTYDFIISAIPHSALPVEAVRGLYETYQSLLKPGGILTYIEFAFTRNLMKTLSPNKENRIRLNKIDNVMNGYIDEYQIDQRFVLRNAPPARVRSLQF